MTKKTVTPNRNVIFEEVLNNIQEIVIHNNDVIFGKVLSNIQVFNSDFINEIKDLYITKAYEKSCLII